MIKVINVISDTNIGGAGRVIINVLKKYNRNKFDIKVMLPLKSKLIKEVETLGVKILEVDGIADKSLDLKAVLKILKIFRKEKPDIVHTHASMSAKIAAKLCGAKTVYTRHSVFPQKRLLTTFPGKQLNGMLNNILSNKIIAVAEAAKQNLVDTGIPAKKIEVVLNGVEGLSEISDDKKRELRAKYRIEENELVVSMIARLDRVKGHEYFIEAAKRIAEKGKPIKFLIAGTGNEEEQLKQLSKKLMVDNNVIFAGFVDNVNEIMNITDIIANCSFGTEATSLALLEAMSISKPAVVTDFGGNVDVIEDGLNGIVVPIKNSDAISKAIIKIFENKDLMTYFRENAQKIYREKFTSEIMTKKIEVIYENLLLSK